MRWTDTFAPACLPSSHLRRVVAWHSGRTSVFGQQTFPVLWVTTYVGKPSATGQPTRATELWFSTRNSRLKFHHSKLDSARATATVYALQQGTGTPRVSTTTGRCSGRGIVSSLLGRRYADCTVYVASWSCHAGPNIHAGVNIKQMYETVWEYSSFTEIDDTWPLAGPMVTFRAVGRHRVVTEACM